MAWTVHSSWRARVVACASVFLEGKQYAVEVSVRIARRLSVWCGCRGRTVARHFRSRLVYRAACMEVAALCTLSSFCPKPTIPHPLPTLHHLAPQCPRRRYPQVVGPRRILSALRFYTPHRAWAVYKQSRTGKHLLAYYRTPLMTRGRLPSSKHQLPSASRSLCPRVAASASLADRNLGQRADEYAGRGQGVCGMGLTIAHGPAEGAD